MITVRDLIDKLMEMNPDMPVYVPTGSDDFGWTFDEAETTGTMNIATMVFPDPDRPFYSEPAVIEVFTIRRYW
jgi:hypothetical protein